MRCPRSGERLRLPGAITKLPMDAAATMYANRRPVSLNFRSPAMSFLASVRIEQINCESD